MPSPLPLREQIAHAIAGIFDTGHDIEFVQAIIRDGTDAVLPLVEARDAECQAAIEALPATFPGDFDAAYSVYRADVLAILRGTTDADPASRGTADGCRCCGSSQ